MAFPRTKIQPPLPRAGSLIERAELDRRLGAALLTRRLVLLCAAAGFGKSSLLARQVQRLPAGTALAWISCDAGDTPMRLFECLVAALEPFDPPWRVAPEALMRAAAEATTAEQRRAVVAEAINALDACDVAHGVIVVDDLHRAPHPVLFEILELLLERLSARWTIAIATREEPPLPLARLRAQDEAAEFRAAELRFSADESAALAAVMGVGADVAARLHERTQGWPAGLRLALDAARASPGGVVAVGAGQIDRHSFDYITAEVIDRLAPPLREFLLRTSVLPVLSAERAAALSGDADAALRIEEIERAGLFATPLASAEPTLRLHDMFRESLEARLRRERPALLPELLQRAALSEPEPLQRVHWWLQAQRWRDAESALAEHAEAAVTQGQSTAMRTLLERFPAAFRDASPRLQRVRTLLGWAAWDWEATIDASARGARLAAAEGDDAAVRAARSYHCVALAGTNDARAREAVQALLADPLLDGDSLARTLLAASWVELRGGDQRALAPLWRRLLDTLAAIPSLPRWYECSPLPPFVGLPGMRGPLLRYVEGALARLPDQATPLRGMVWVVQGWLHLWVGEVEAAESCAEAAAADARWLARPVNVDSYSRGLRSVLLALRGRHAEALAVARSLLADVESSRDPLRARVYRSLYLFLAMRCAAIGGDDTALAEFAARLAGIDAGEQGWLSRHQRGGAAAMLALARGELDLACARWRELLAAEHACDLHGQVVETRLRLADTLLRRGRPQGEAVAVLAPLFQRLGESGEWGAVWMAGPAVLSRLADHDWGTELAPDLRTQLQHWAARAAALQRPPAGASAPAAAAVPAGTAGLAAAAPAPLAVAPAAPAPPGGGAGLSSRELEVLERIAAGDSNKLIARAFDLSPHTVKRHVANILDKLGLTSRGQAAAWFHERRPG